MKVDRTGQPVGEGTYGLYMGHSARVSRIMVNPIEDDTDAQVVINEGGYMVSLGAAGENLSTPAEFVVHPGDKVLAADGTEVGVGDEVEIRTGSRPPSSKAPHIIGALYPIATLQGQVCATLKGVTGSGPDGKFALKWGGSIVRVIKKAGKAETEGPWETPVGPVHVGDRVEIQRDELRMIAKVVGLYMKDPTEGSNLTFTIEEILEGESRLQPGSTCNWYAHRITEILSKSIDDMKVGDWVYFTGDRGVEGSGIIHFIEDGGKGNIRVSLDQENAEKLGFGGDPTYKYFVWRKNILGVRPSAPSTTPTTTEETPEMTDSTNDSSQETGVAKREKKFTKIDVVAEGTRLILPLGMSNRSAIKELTRLAEQDEMDVNIMELIEGFPLDAAHAFIQAMTRKYGWVNALPTPGFFGPTPPTMVGVQVDPDGRTVQIPWGKLGIPGISGTLSTGIQFVDNRPVFCIGGTIKQKDKVIVNEIAQMAREYLAAGGSIYKGKAIRIKFPDNPKAFSPLDNQPKFIQTTDVRPEELIFSDAVAKQVSVNIWTPIRCLAAVQNARVPLKRGVLLYGRYGVGKTLLASVTARMAVQAGVTFIDLEDSRQLPQAIPFARQLGGMVVIFAEDIDRCDENGTRSDAFNEILNTVDGLTSKTDQVLIVYTTNHIDRISKAMLRQGRIDKVIHIKEPDEVAAQKLVRLYARHMLAPDANISKVGGMLAGFIPAAIREVVEQSKLAAIERGDVHNITPEDLELTALNTREHMELLKEPVKDDRSDLEKMGEAVGRQIGATIGKVIVESYTKWDGEETSELDRIGTEATEALVAGATRRRR